MPDGIDVILDKFYSFVTSNFEGILSKILPDGVSVGDLSGLIPTSAGSSNSMLAFLVTEDQAGFKLKVPLSGAITHIIGSTLEFECKIKYSGPEISCELILNEPKWFSIIKDGAIWVAREATEFFDETGDVIAAIATDAFEAAG